MHANCVNWPGKIYYRVKFILSIISQYRTGWVCVIRDWDYRKTHTCYHLVKFLVFDIISNLKALEYGWDSFPFAVLQRHSKCELFDLQAFLKHQMRSVDTVELIDRLLWMPSPTDSLSAKELFSLLLWSVLQLLFES